MEGLRRTARVRVTDSVGRRAAEAALARVGWLAGDAGPVIADRTPADVLLVGSTARDCHDALAATARGDVSVALTYDHLDGLGCALEALGAGFVTVSKSMTAIAAPLHSLTERQVEVLAAVASGLQTADIGVRLGMSVPSVKREIANLQRHFDAPSPAALVATGHKLGYG